MTHRQPSQLHSNLPAGSPHKLGSTVNCKSAATCLSPTTRTPLTCCLSPTPRATVTAFWSGACTFLQEAPSPKQYIQPGGLTQAAVQAPLRFPEAKLHLADPGAQVSKSIEILPLS